MAKPGSSTRKRNGVKRARVRRWSETRYKFALEVFLGVLKSHNAVFGKPMLRKNLREEARGVIKDTGLLDNALKNMAGSLAPGENERFCRRCNLDGAMEFWLERADLVEIRRQVGVDDPYWIPPPGWKLGGSPSKDPTCTSERILEVIREEMMQMKLEICEELLKLWKGVAKNEEMCKELLKLWTKMAKNKVMETKDSTQLVDSSTTDTQLLPTQNPCASRINLNLNLNEVPNDDEF